MNEEIQARPSGPAPSMKPRKGFRWPILLLLPLGLAIVVGIHLPRQMRQKEALQRMETIGGIMRTEPISLPLWQTVFGDDLSQQIVEIYLIEAEPTVGDLRVVGGVPTLTKLELSRSAVGNEHVAALEALHGLHTLHLARTGVTDAGLAHLVGMRQLGTLSLSGTAVGDEGMQHVARLVRLERLHADGTAVGDEGLPALAALTGLRELDLRGTRITSAGLKHLKPLVNLELLKVSDSVGDPEAIAELQQSLPRCHVLTPASNDM